MNIVMDTPQVTLRVYPEKKMVYHEMHKFAFGESFQDLLIKGAEAFEKYGCTKWLSDDRGNSATRPEDVEWAQAVWEPRILRAGWKYWAIVMPEKVIGQMSMKRLAARYNQMGVTVEAFSDPQKAMAWIERQ
ncbi:MAG: hypothetical protein KDJ65_19645 [Anaerolineae bacterium]|nr:hypothetical protein [Anaerolineae bacterium]